MPDLRQDDVHLTAPHLGDGGQDDYRDGGQDDYAIARITRRSFLVAEEKARELLREKGFTNKQIEIELSRPRRRPLDDW